MISGENEQDSIFFVPQTNQIQIQLKTRRIKLATTEDEEIIDMQIMTIEWERIIRRNSQN